MLLSVSVVEVFVCEVNLKLVLLLLFNVVNVLICVWEIVFWMYCVNV